MKPSLCQGSGPELVHGEVVWSPSSRFLRRTDEAAPCALGDTVVSGGAPRGDKDAALSRLISCVESWH